MVCLVPSSKTSKFSFFRSGTSLLPSSTVAFSATSSTSACRTKPAPSLWITPASVPGGSASGERTGSRSTVNGGAWLDCVFAAGEGEGGAACCAPSANVAPARKIAKTRLLQWRIVAGTSMDGQRRQSLRRIRLHFHFTPFAIAGQILGAVADYVLVAQFGRDFLCNVAHFCNVVAPEEPSAGLFTQVIQQQRPGALFRGGCVRVKDADGVDFHIRLPHL